MFKQLLIVICSAIPIFSLSYNTNDRYSSSDYTANVISVNSISALEGKAGTHNYSLNTAAMQHLNSNISNIINVYDGNNLLASGYLFKANGSQDPWNNVVVIADGYDPENERKIDFVVSDENYKLIFSANPVNKSYAPLCNGFAMLFVDFNNGTADIRTNAKAYLKVLEEVNKRTNTAITAAGNSMGGMIVRLALLYAEKKEYGERCAQIDQVTKMIAIDAPLNGAAALPIDLQAFIKEEKSDIYNKKINTDAAKQLFYKHLEAGNNYNDEFNKFQSFIHGMGDYPQNVKKYSLANADWVKPYTYSSASYNIDLNVRYGIYTAYYISPAPFPPFPDWAYSNKSKKINYKSIKYSNHDLAPGSIRNTVVELDKEVISKLNSANLLLKVENTFLNVIGQSSAAITGGFVKIKGTSLSSSLSQSNFKPTHVPIYSAFDLSASTPESYKNANSLEKLCRGGYSPFDKLYLCSTRNEHITYSKEFCSQLMSVLKDKTVDNTPVINFMLNRNNY